jgi:integrase/recombinase XerD
MITLIHSIPEQQKTSNIEKYNLIDFVQEYANERKPQTGKEGIGRYGSIISLKQHLIKFGAKNTWVSQVDLKFIKRFIEYLKEAHDIRPQLKNRRKLSDGTIYLMFSIMRSITLELYKKKIIAENPFTLLPAQYRLKRPESHRNYLNKHELSKVIESKCPYAQLKETFLFSCFTGLRKSDILSLPGKKSSGKTGRRTYSRKFRRRRDGSRSRYLSRRCNGCPNLRQAHQQELSSINYRILPFPGI